MLAYTGDKGCFVREPSYYFTVASYLLAWFLPWQFNNLNVIDQVIGHMIILTQVDG